MSTSYHPYKIALTDGQKKKLQKAYVSKTAVTLRVKPGEIGRGGELLLTATQISRLKKTAAAGKGVELKLSQIQIQNTAVWWKFVFCCARFGTTFDKASPWGISKCRFEFRR